MKRTLWILVGAVALTVAGWLLFGGKATGAAEKYKAELRAKGEKLTFAELGFPKPPQDGFSLMRLTNAVNRIRRSNVDAGKFTSVSATAPSRQQVVWRGEGILLNQSTNPMAWGELSALLRNVSNELFEVRLAAEQPLRRYQLDPGDYLTNFPNVPMFPFVELRNAAQFLYADGIEALHVGDLSRARQDHHTLIQLTEFNREDPLLVAAMIRVAITGLNLQFTWQALQHGDWTEADLAAMQRDWERVDLLASVEAGFLGERAATELAFAITQVEGMEWLFRTPNGRAATRSPLERVPWFFSRLFWDADADELFALRFHQTTLEAIRALRAGASWTVAGRAIQSHQTTHSKTMANAKGLQHFRYLLSRMMLPNASKAVQSTIRNETQRRLTIIAIALKRFHLRHQRWPEKLEELVPAFLTSGLVDPMSSESLRYRRDGEAGFVLYSVGEDGKDDGGDAEPAVKVTPHDWWTGRDVVWPKPAN